MLVEAIAAGLGCVMLFLARPDPRRGQAFCRRLLVVRTLAGVRPLPDPQFPPRPDGGEKLRSRKAGPLYQRRNGGHYEASEAYVRFPPKADINPSRELPGSSRSSHIPDDGDSNPHQPCRARTVRDLRPAPSRASGQGGGRQVVQDRLGFHEPAGDQPPAIKELTEAAPRASGARCCSASPARARPSPWPRSSRRCSGRRWCSRPNKILAAQLYGEFKSFFPDNAVEYFVSYYDYYQPEAYVPRTDTYIEKESSVNEAIDRMRHSATRSLLERDDVIIVASVSLPLRHRLGRDLFGDDLQPEEGRARGPARGHPQARRAAVQAQRPGLRARQFPGARRQSGDLPVAL